MARRPEKLFLMAFLLLPILGCGSKPLPSVENVEQMLSVEYPDDVRIVGGYIEPGTSLLALIVSDNPLPRPPRNEPKTSRRSRAVRDVEFPVSALGSLAAAYMSPDEDVTGFTQERGRCHEGQVGNYDFNYREAPIETGWLTAVEIFAIESKPAEEVTR